MKPWSSGGRGHTRHTNTTPGRNLTSLHQPTCDHVIGPIISGICTCDSRTRHTQSIHHLRETLGPNVAKRHNIPTTGDLTSPDRTSGRALNTGIHKLDKTSPPSRVLSIRLRPNCHRLCDRRAHETCHRRLSIASSVSTTNPTTLLDASASHESATHAVRKV